ncbi:hypothetical protein [Hymenobacter algoricola]|uniref:CBM-cenC domain-containing protein n=1 Tax=Hymenobacter algoricola TaxID=486267 RepID=A0ABP7N2F5_9BACT
MKKLLYAVFALSLVACGEKSQDVPANQLVRNDFDALDGWMGNNPVPSLTREQAHSGRYSIKVGPESEYSIGFNSLLGRLSPTRIKKIKISGWAYSPALPANGIVVTELKDLTTGKQLLWQGLELSKEVKEKGKWIEIEKVIELPADAASATNLSVYLWRGSGQQTVYLDDLTITSEE